MVDMTWVCKVEIQILAPVNFQCVAKIEHSMFVINISIVIINAFAGNVADRALN